MADSNVTRPAAPGGGLVQKIGAVSDRIAYVTGYLSGWMLMAMMVLILVEVVSRYILHSPLMVSDEMSAYMYVFISLVGAAYTMSTGGHIRIDFAVHRLRSKARGWLRIATLLIFMAYAILCADVSWQFVIQSFTRGMRSGSWVMTPLWIPQLALPVGFTLLSITVIAEVVRSVATVRAGGEIDVTESGGIL